MKRIFILAIIMAMVMGFSVQAYAGLTTIGQAQYGGQNYNLIWDNDSPFGSIVWLDYDRGYDTWQNYVNWTAGLNSGGVLTYNIDPLYSVTWGGDWCLPSTVDGPYVFGYDGTTTAGYNITSSEMGHLFYTELGNKGYCDTSGNCPQSGWGLTNTGDFQNLGDGPYWSGTEHAADPDFAWDFGLTGYQGTSYKGYYEGYYKGVDLSALAVRPGDVTVVPEPISSILFITGGATLAVRRYIKRKKQ